MPGIDNKTGMFSRITISLILVSTSLLFAPESPAAEGYRHEILFGGAYKHAPVQEEDCTVCHDMHFSRAAGQLLSLPPDLCLECHDRFRGKVVHDPVAAGRCLSCHEAHTSSIPGLLSSSQEDLCPACHANRKGGRHGTKTVKGPCTDCHDPHVSDSAALLSGNPGGECVTCHTAVTADANIHTAVAEGECPDCHNPHASPPQATLPCVECHDDKVAGKVIHPPLEDGCTECHEPHSGPNEYQLILGVPGLCLECHDDREGGKHGSVELGTDCVRCHDPHSTNGDHLVLTDAVKAPCASCHTAILSGSVLHTPLEEGRCERCHDPHGDPPVATASCVKCHESILAGGLIHQPASEDCGECHSAHSSDFSKQLLARKEEICLECHDERRGGRHGRVTMDPDCVQCHDPHSASRPGLLKVSSDTEGCETCHGDRKSGTVVHTPLRWGECTDCHDPHADPPKAVSACLSCHREILKKTVVHEPADDDCSNCHDTHAGDRALLLQGAVPDLCLDCHDDKEGGSHGRTVTSPACLDCHNPHASDRRSLMKDLEGRGCESCHQGKTSGKYVHGGLKGRSCAECHDPHSDDPKPPPRCSSCHSGLIDRSPLHASQRDDECTGCHDPHSADSPKLLIGQEESLGEDCLSCHSRVQRRIEKGKSKHMAVTDGDCLDCHTAHVGDAPYTVESFLAAISGPFDQSAFDLCFQCHSERKIISQFTTSETAFRRGSYNLHYLHVVRDGNKGYSCKTCHDIHASDQLHLIRREVPINPRYSIKINYRETASGGSCETNCHVVRGYER